MRMMSLGMRMVSLEIIKSGNEAGESGNETGLCGNDSNQRSQFTNRMLKQFLNGNWLSKSHLLDVCKEVEIIEGQVCSQLF